MIRKDFLKASGMLTAAGLFSSLVPAMAHQPRVSISGAAPFKKGLSFYMIKEELSIMDKFLLVKDLGFDGIEFNGPLTLPIKELLAARDKTGIAIPALVNSDHWGKPLSSPNAAERQFTIQSVAKTMEETALLGGDTVLVVPGVVSEQVSYKTAYDNALASIRQLLPTAEKTGVKIGLENVWNNFIVSPMEALHFLETINHPLVGWYFDIGNILRYGWPEHWIEALGSKIVKCHVKEFSRKIMMEEGLRKGFNVELGAGDVNWPQVMQSLRQQNNPGEWLILEMGAGDRTHLAKLSQQLDQILAPPSNR